MSYDFFTADEMVKHYRGAKDKANQIRVFCDTNGMTIDEVKQILLAKGIKQQELPRAKRKKVAEDMPKRPIEDALIEREDTEETQTHTRPVSMRTTVGLDLRSECDVFLAKLKARRSEIYDQIAEPLKEME